MDRRGLLRAGLAVLSAGRFAVSEIVFLDGEFAQTQNERLLDVAREIMKAARYCALITLDASGRAQARTMDAFPPDNDMVVWFGTNPLSRKVKEIERDPRVTLYYFDPQAQGYVTIHGTARLVNDAEEKKTRWKDDWKEFYPDRDRSYLLIAVTPERIEVVSPKHGIAGGSAGWAPPSVNVPPERPKP
jgi:general stress protein 26